MAAEDCLRAGNLAESLAQLEGQIRKQPADPKLRVFLFQLLAVLGRWERAAKQLNVLTDLDPATIAMVQTYGPALQCEGVRAEVFAGKRAPLIFGEPEQWMALLLNALQLTGEGKFAEAAATRQQALELAPTTSGTITLGGPPSAPSDGKAFEWIADADSRLGPMLEAVVNGRYQWIPFHRIKKLRVETPVDLRDLVWTPAYLTVATGGEIVALIPTRYPGSENGDDALRMAKKTEWVEKDADTFLGLGQRVLTTDQGDHPLLAAVEIQLEVATTDG